ncbi:MAG: DUF4397 domain-containing protein [Chloroherpetonaceae bacterium]
MKTYKFLWTMVLLPTLALTSACAPDINEPNDSLPSAQVRFIHSAATASQLDFAVMNTVGATLLYVQRETEYGRQYRYDFFKTGERDFRLLPSRTTFNIARTVARLDANLKFTAFAIDAENAVDTLLLIAQDTLATPSEGKAFVRFVHASSNAGAISIAGENVSVSNFERRGVSPYFTVDAGSYNFTIQFSDNTTLSVPQTFFSQGVYTLVISGFRNASANQVPLNVRSYLDVSL